MTSTVNAATISALTASTYDLLTTTVGVAVVLALLVLLFQREIANIILGDRAEAWEWTFDVALVPLVFVFVVIVAARLAELLV